ncbi:TonB-dependent receptor [Parablastomonas sp. CN1-191]|uniref:TonB-dependent receptor n=1 Tax=Parablastomonas sp. CN1-191 TaxID=3400908 RepID=UPI003BF8921E
MTFRLLLASTALVAPAALLPAAAFAAEPAPAADAAADGAPAQEIVITARKLDAARDRIDPALGASTYSIDRAQLDNQPGGADRNLKGVLLQAPGVAQDSDGDGDIHIRNEHGNVQYRLNGVTVPQGFAGFGAVVDPRVASSVEVITGALPAQYGFRTAGVVNMKTRTDGFDLDGDVGIYGGSHRTFQPSATFRDGIGSLNVFASASYLQNDLGISNPTPSKDAIHDRTRQYRAFGYVSDVLSDNSRLSAFGGWSKGSFQIPNTPGLTPTFTLNGRTTFDSALLDQNQRQNSVFGVLAYQYAGAALDVQVAPFFSRSRAHYTPDPTGGQLMFDGSETDLAQATTAYGVQADAGLKLGERHTLRTGVFFSRQTTATASINRVFAVDAAGNQASDAPITIPIAQRQAGSILGLYLQDEWHPVEPLTVNVGLRYDRATAPVSEDQFSPRASVVWKPSRWTTLHAGYARYFTPAPLEIAVAPDVALFDGTTNQFAVKYAGPVRAEREHNFDIGLQQFLTPRLSITLDAYYKDKTNLLDEEHFGATLIQSPFNYGRSKGWGVEAGFNYEAPGFEFYGNLARGQQKAKEIVSNQFFFDQPELDYIAGHYIYTDHSQKWTGSAGGALTIRNGLGKLIPSFDLIYGSGLRAEDPAGIVPNGGTQKPYVQVNLGVSQNLASEKDDEAWTLRFDIVNLFDKVYLIHDGSGVGAGQPEYGPRRGFFVGLRKSF